MKAPCPTSRGCSTRGQRRRIAQARVSPVPQGRIRESEVELGKSNPVELAVGISGHRGSDPGRHAHRAARPRRRARRTGRPEKRTAPRSPSYSHESRTLRRRTSQRCGSCARTNFNALEVQLRKDPQYQAKYDHLIPLAKPILKAFPVARDGDVSTHVAGLTRRTSAPPPPPHPANGTEPAAADGCANKPQPLRPNKAAELKLQTSSHHDAGGDGRRAGQPTLVACASCKRRRETTSEAGSAHAVQYRVE